MQTPGWIRGPLARLAAQGAKGEASSGTGPNRRRIAVLATGIVGVLAVAGMVAATLGTARPAAGPP